MEQVQKELDQEREEGKVDVVAIRMMLPVVSEEEGEMDEKVRVEEGVEKKGVRDEC